MSYAPENPLIVQSDLSVLVEVNSPHYEEARDVLARFAELEKSPEHIHTYKISPLSLWNAAAVGFFAPEILSTLERFSKYDIPQNVAVEIQEIMGRYGRIRLDRSGADLVLSADDPILMAEIWRHKAIAPYLKGRIDECRVRIDLFYRGHLKQALTRIGFPVKDLAGYFPGKKLTLHFRTTTASGVPLQIRDYQKEALETFYAGGGPEGGSGIVVLPCGRARPWWAWPS